MSGPFKQKGWEAYTKVKNKPIKSSTTETDVIKSSDVEKGKFKREERKLKKKDVEKSKFKREERKLKKKKKPVPKPKGGFMHPPYKKPVGPTEKPHYVHGYKTKK